VANHLHNEHHAFPQYPPSAITVLPGSTMKTTNQFEIKHLPNNQQVSSGLYILFLVVSEDNR